MTEAKTANTSTFDVIWYTVTNTTKKRVPAWMRSCALDAGGELWVPAVLAGNEMAVLLVCGYDGEGVFSNHGHLYVRASWMGREYPKLRPLLEKMRRNAAERAERDNAHPAPPASRALSREK